MPWGVLKATPQPGWNPWCLLGITCLAHHQNKKFIRWHLQMGGWGQGHQMGPLPYCHPRSDSVIRVGSNPPPSWQLPASAQTHEMSKQRGTWAHRPQTSSSDSVCQWRGVYGLVLPLVLSADQWHLQHPACTGGFSRLVFQYEGGKQSLKLGVSIINTSFPYIPLMGKRILRFLHTKW